jgi:site-specific DNA-adenine methylase
MQPIIGRMGGKSRIRKQIINYFIEGYEDMTYVEPFIGGGSIFLYKDLI